jgi:hypothetical protein
MADLPIYFEYKGIMRREYNYTYSAYPQKKVDQNISNIIYTAHIGRDQLLTPTTVLTHTVPTSAPT